MKTKTEYTAVEAAAIDLLHSFPLQRQHDAGARIPEQHMKQLTNARREAARGQGIRLLDDIIDEKAAPPLTAKIPLLLITLKPWVQLEEKEEIAGGNLRDGYGYKREWLTSSVRTQNLEEIGKAVSAWWPINIERIRKEGIQYVVAVHRGVTRAVFKIKPDSWVEKLILGKKRRAFDFEIIRQGDEQIDGIGDLYDALVGEYGKCTPKKALGDQSFINYWNEEMWLKKL